MGVPKQKTPKSQKSSLTHGDLRLSFQTLIKLRNSGNYPNMKVVKKVALISNSFQQLCKQSEDAYNGLVKAYALLDDSGELLRPEGKPDGFTVPDEKVPEWKESAAKFMDTKIELELPWGKLTLDEVAKVGLSPNDLTAAAFLID